MTGKHAHYMFISRNYVTDPNSMWGIDVIRKSDTGLSSLRIFLNSNTTDTIEFLFTLREKVQHKEQISQNEHTQISPNDYQILLNGKVVEKSIQLKNGGIYTLLVTQLASGEYQTKLVEVIKHNTISILWIIPQLLALSLGELMFAIPFLVFSYSQAPESVRTTMQCAWMLAISLGDVIVMVIAYVDPFESRAHEYFMYACLMFVVILIFMGLAYRYQPNDPNVNK